MSDEEKRGEESESDDTTSVHFSEGDEMQLPLSLEELKWTEGLSYDIWLFEIIIYNKNVKVYEHLQYWHSSIITIIRHSISQLFGWEI